ncbi:aromatic prenyltransferase [Streptomyces aquilus]|uniref:aromatic prenyltransferase n=1 Tax=Streptomyces aquilus TaxID=2548456 RepID=UPI0036A6E2B2
MSGATAAEELYSAIEESARMVDAVCSRDKVWPILTAFGEKLPTAMVVFSVLTGERNAGQLDFCFTIPNGTEDPYTHALRHGLVTATDHPVGSLLADLHAAGIDIAEHFIDSGAASGFKKVYAHFPRDLQKVSALADIASMPPAVGANLDLFARYGLDEVAMFGIDYRSRTISLYFQFAPDRRPEPGTLRSMLDEIGLPEPSAPMLEFARKSFRANFTLGWDSPKIQRVAFAPPLGPGLNIETIPAPVEPHIKRFATSAPRTYSGERMNLFAVKWMPAGEFLEVCSYYQISPSYEPVRLMAAHKEQA